MTRIIILDPYIPVAYIANMMTLSEYLEHSGISQAAFADAIKVKQATVSRLARNIMRPSLELAVCIERATGGAVVAASWVTVSVGADSEGVFIGEPHDASR